MEWTHYQIELKNMITLTNRTSKYRTAQSFTDFIHAFKLQDPESCFKDLVPPKHSASTSVVKSFMW